jgi:hypothetical protein
MTDKIKARAEQLRKLLESCTLSPELRAKYERELAHLEKPSLFIQGLKELFGGKPNA